MRQMAQFNDELNQRADVIIMVGDLFDHPHISRAVVAQAARAMLAAAENNPNTQFVAMAGNHDVPRNLVVIGGFNLFCRIVNDRLANLRAISEPVVMDRIAYFPWQWDKSVDEQVRDMAGYEAELAVGHWDLQKFGDDESHLVPVDKLRAVFGNEVVMVSGHFHKPGLYGDVICTGSMQPVSHGEDPDEQFYVTRKLEEVLEDPSAYRNKHLRVLLKPGEELPKIDCLGLTHLRLTPELEAAGVTTSLDAFDWTTKLRDRIMGLPEIVRQFVYERLPDAAPRAEEQR